MWSSFIFNVKNIKIKVHFKLKYLSALKKYIKELTNKQDLQTSFLLLTPFLIYPLLVSLFMIKNSEISLIRKFLRCHELTFLH